MKYITPQNYTLAPCLRTGFKLCSDFQASSILWYSKSTQGARQQPNFLSVWKIRMSSRLFKISLPAILGLHHNDHLIPEGSSTNSDIWSAVILKDLLVLNSAEIQLLTAPDFPGKCNSKSMFHAPGVHLQVEKNYFYVNSTILEWIF